MIIFCSNLYYFFLVPSSQEQNCLEHVTNPAQASENEQHLSEPSIHEQPLPIAGSDGKFFYWSYNPLNIREYYVATFVLSFPVLSTEQLTNSAHASNSQVSNPSVFPTIGKT
jgi:hypothetical protein